MSIKFILFDWGGTLGKSGHRHKFIKNHFSKKLKHLRNDTLPTLEMIYEAEIPMGILSNTDFKRSEMLKALKETGMDKYFECYIYSSDKNMCSKPCKQIFEKAFDCAKKIIPNIKYQEILYVGNDFFKDVVTPSQMGMQTALLVNNNAIIHNITNNIIHALQINTHILNSLFDLKHLLTNKKL